MVRVVVFALFALAALPCAAQYPDRNVTFLANFPPGGLVDIVTRVIADGMKPKFPHGITVVNKPGAGGAVGVTDLIQAKPDGYTILLTPQSSLVIAPQMNPKLAYKTPDEYDPVINVVAYYPLLAVTADAPWKSIQDFVADPGFAKTMDARGVDVDYRAGEALRADLWREYKLNTEILKRIGLIK